MFDRNSRIIRDGNTLSFEYIPEKLVGREAHTAELERLFSPLAFDGKSCSAFLWGGVGTGKTAIAKRFCLDMGAYFQEKGRRMGTVYTNCRIKNSEYAVMLDAVRHFDPSFPDRGFALDELISILVRSVESKKEALVIILDEVDVMLKGPKKNIIYQLSRLPEQLSAGSISLILISQYPLATMIDEASMSTFRRSNMISFARYTLDELLAIVRYRAGLALSDGALSDESAGLIANVSSEYGDARYALEILERAAHVAEAAGESEVTPDCIRTASASVYSDVSEVKLNNLDRNKKIVLLAISRAIKSAASVSMTKCEKTYAVVCEEYNVPAKKHTQFYTYVMDMEKMALLRTEVKREPDGGRVTYISIDSIPPKELANKLEYLLDEEARGETDLE
ncbi:MAG: AAA family ATPase [Candidatus Methanomethylophilus sp.]|nr:AAA family ATPase [Methanomethylophilus sp.]